MSRQTTKASHFHVIGYIETRSDRTHVGKHPQFRLVGYYDPKISQTKDSNFGVVGHGDMPCSLITSAQ